jgi:hypothetical protein
MVKLSGSKKSNNSSDSELVESGIVLEGDLRTTDLITISKSSVVEPYCSLKFDFFFTKLARSSLLRARSRRFDFSLGSSSGLFAISSSRCRQDLQYSKWVTSRTVRTVLVGEGVMYAPFRFSEPIPVLTSNARFQGGMQPIGPG